jgi:hypothetical protein
MTENHSKDLERKHGGRDQLWFSWIYIKHCGYYCFSFRLQTNEPWKDELMLGSIRSCPYAQWHYPSKKTKIKLTKIKISPPILLQKE